MSSSNSPSSGGNPASLKSSIPSEARLLSNGEDRASTTSALMMSQGSSSDGGGASNLLSESHDSSPRGGKPSSARLLTASQDSLSGGASNLKPNRLAQSRESPPRGGGCRGGRGGGCVGGGESWDDQLQDESKHGFDPATLSVTSDHEEDDENESIGTPSEGDDEDDIGRVIDLLHAKGLQHFAKLIFAMNALFMMQSMLEQAKFEVREILRFFRLVIKIFSPEPPKRASAGVPRQQKRKNSKVPEQSTSRFEIMMKIWRRTGVRDFVCDAQKVIRGIFLSTANPMVVSSIISAINAIDQFSDPNMKRMCLFLIALASGISCDSLVVKSPQLLANFFENVYDAISEGMHEGPFKFDRDTVLPTENFPQEFANEAWRILNYINHMFANIPNSPAESSAGKKAVSKKPQGAAEGGKQVAKKSADDNPFKDFEGFDADVVDDATILTNACSAINPEDLPVFMQHIFYCFYHAIGLVEEDDGNIMGLTTVCSLEFALLSLLHAPMQPIPAIAFTQFKALLSNIDNVGVSKFQINHPKSADFLSKLACLVRLLLPEGEKAEEWLETMFKGDMQTFVSGKNLSSVMHELYSLFREQLLDDKRKVLDQIFTGVFPRVELSSLPDAKQKTIKKRDEVKFRAIGGGAAAENESIGVVCRDIDLRQFQAFKRDQAAFEQWQQEKAASAKGEKK